MTRRPVARGVRGDRVALLRKQLRMSQQAVSDRMAAEGAEVHQTYISSVERGGHSLNADSLAALSKALRTNPGYLLGITDDPRPHDMLEKEVTMRVANPKERALVEELFRLIEDLDPEMKQGYIDALTVMYEGLVARAQRLQAERARDETTSTIAAN